MNLNTLLIIIGASTIIASILNIIAAFKDDSKLGKKLTITISVIVLIAVVVIYFKYDVIINKTLPPPPPTEAIDIKGNYTGYFIDKLGTEVPTYMEIKLDSITDSIKFIFKNDFTVIRNGEYDISNHRVTVDGLTNAEVIEKNGKVIIESKGNIGEKWKFIKDRRAY